MLHHISFGVSDLEHAAAFYDAVLAPLGYVRVWDDLRPGEDDQAVGYGTPGSGDKLAIKHRPAALSHGGHDNGGPGLRLHYGPHYYAAFVVDPDGHNIEAVFNGIE
jgi:catechol 2,3-dioxygenase-like lactoylglutathione lyase family enzyme